MEKIISPQAAERQFKHKGGGWFKFKDNRAFLLGNILCSYIFNNLNNIRNYSNDFVNTCQPNGLYVYDAKDCKEPKNMNQTSAPLTMKQNITLIILVEYSFPQHFL